MSEAPDADLAGCADARSAEAAPEMAVIAAVAPVRRAPRFDGPLDTEALRGERVRLLEETEEGWARVQLVLDGYWGYMPRETLARPGRTPTHWVSALAGFVLPAPELKQPAADRLTFGARVAVLGETGGYARIEGGYIWARHLSPIGTPAYDFVTVAERFLGVPYLWGGRSSLGLDCSALVQLALAATGIPAPRDSGPQESELGDELCNWETAGLRRGDLVFWKGHVGIMCSATELLHANAHHMAVAIEPFAPARARIAAAEADVRRVKRFAA